MRCIMPRVAIAAVLLLGLLLAACSRPEPVSQGTSGLMVKLTMEELVAQSDWIVVGTVTGMNSQWDRDHTSIYTLVTVSVEDWVKGKPDSPDSTEILITVPGGKVGKIAQGTEDVASFNKGEKVVTFLQRNDDGTIGVVGGFQGKFTIEDGQIAGSDQSLDEFISQIKAIGKGAK